MQHKLFVGALSAKTSSSLVIYVNMNRQTRESQYTVLKMRERLEQGTATVGIDNLSRSQDYKNVAIAHDLLLRCSSSLASDADFEA